MPNELFFIVDTEDRRPIGFAALSNASLEHAQQWIQILANPRLGDPNNARTGWKIIKYVRAEE